MEIRPFDMSSRSQDNFYYFIPGLDKTTRRTERYGRRQAAVYRDDTHLSLEPGRYCVSVCVVP